MKYSGKENPYLEEDVDEYLMELIELIRRKYLSTKSDYQPVDLATICSYLTLDVISSLTFGKRIGYLDKNEDLYGFLKQTYTRLPSVLAATTYPEFSRSSAGLFFKSCYHRPQV